MRRVAIVLLLGLWSAAPVHAQESQRETVVLRVSSLRPRGVLVDRGSIDGLAVGDHVLFRRRGGGLVDGQVVEVGERNALVLLADTAVQLELGTRGEASVLSSRRAGAVAPIEPAPVELDPQAAPPEHPDWKNQDEAYQDGQPLLSHVRPLRPSEREPLLTGRVFTILDAGASSEDDRESGFERLGTSLRLDNRFGFGESVFLDLELEHRRSDVPDLDDEDSLRLRLDRASYSVGDSRFARERLEFGRFLQSGMPHFGVLDGLEWSRRLDGGDRFGASLGFMPEPDPEYGTGADLQVATYYRWVHDESEVLSAAAGAQKSFHHGDADRDLVVGEVSYLPQVGWNAMTTLWVDYYTAGDAAKGAGVELTQAIARVARRADDDGELGLTFTHLSLPEIDRQEFLPPLANELANDRHDRLALELLRPWKHDLWWRFEGGAWSDEDEAGWDGELGGEWRGSFLDRARSEVTLFAVQGRFSQSLGARARFALDDEHGTWSTEYEFVHHTIDGFDADNDELPQHRLRASRDWHTLTGWSFAFDVDAWLWDEEHSFALGVYLQRSF